VSAKTNSPSPAQRPAIFCQLHSKSNRAPKEERQNEMKTNMQTNRRTTFVNVGRTQYIMAALIALASISTLRAEEKQVTIPAGTAVVVKLDKAVSSSDKPGTQFSGVLQGDLGPDGAVKTGSAVIGQVTEAKKAKRVRGKAQVTFALTQVNVNGKLVTLTTEPIEDIAASSTKKTAKGAAKGAAIGAIADGGDGAAKGAAIGAGASAVKKGESAGVEAGDIVTFKLAAPLLVTVK
jgi:hypothetical protein